MRKLITILFVCLLAFQAKAQTANAGADQTIYLTSGNTATLDGSASSGSTYAWTEITPNPFDYLSGTTITNSTSKVATVSGLPQGVFYFQIAVTSGGTTHTDIMTVKVDLQAAPPTSTLIKPFNIAGIAPYANDRTGDLVADYNGYTSKNLFSDGSWSDWIERSHAGGAAVDAQNGKYIATLADGYDWHGVTDPEYDRTEMYYGGYSVDTAVTYCFEWKGYFPQTLIGAISQPLGYENVGTFMQIHGDDGETPPFGFGAEPTKVFFNDINVGVTTTLTGIDDATWLNKAHTIRFYLKEGSAGTGAFLKVMLDGILKYQRNTGKVGQTLGADWPKFTTLYDWGNAVVDPTNTTRHKTFSLVTEAFNIYSLTDTTGISGGGGGGVIAAPTANAGSNQTLTLPTSSASLSGSATSAAGHTSTYLWTKVSGAGTQSISSSTTLTPSVSGMTTAGNYVFKLTVTQDDSQTANSNVTITVNNAAAPIVSAGANQTITLPTSSKSLTGTATAASGESMTAYLWTKLSGAGSQTITNSTTLTPTISGLSAAGNYVFNLKGTQTDGQYSNSSVTITVNSESNPTIYAGSDQTVNHGSIVSLASTHTIVSGHTATYNWVNETNGTGTFASQTSTSTTVSGLADGTFRFGVTLTQDDSKTAYDYVMITVTPLPTVSAGSSRTITLPTTSVSLNGTATAASGYTMSNYLWTKVSGSGTQSISGNTTLTPTITGLSASGNYVFNLKGTQSDGQYANSTVMITVIAAPPTANAGANQTITLPTSSKSLTGSATSSSGHTSTYLWEKVSGTGTQTVSNSTTFTPTVSGMTVAGSYIFKLTVTQDDGQTATDNVTITVNNAAAPTVTTSGNQTITTSSTTVFSTPTPASGQSVTSFDWTQTSGPAASITSSASQNTGITGISVGTSVFRITITQTDGQTAFANVSVVRTAAPTANAGTDQTIYLPTTSKSLTGAETHASGTTATYLWTKISGSGTQTITNSTTLNPTISGMTVLGDYIFRLTVNQSDAQVATDDVKITVNAATVAPTVSVSANQTIITNSATVSATPTWASGHSGTILWTQTGGATAIISNPTSATTTITGIPVGTSVFKCTVTQDDAQTGNASTTIIFTAAPTANAGGNKTITLPTSSVSLLGSQTHASGTTATYLWTQISGGGTETITGNTTLTPTISGFSIAGTYIFNLQVTQSDTQTANSTSTITVNPVLAQTITVITSGTKVVYININ